MLETGDFLIKELLENGVVDRNEVERATQHAAESGQPVPDALVEIGAVTSHELSLARAVIAELPYVDLDHYEINMLNAELLPRSVAESLCAFPLFALEDGVTVGMLDPMDFRAVDQLRQHLRADVLAVAAEPEKLRRLISRAYSLKPVGQGEQEDAGAADLTTGEEPIVAAVNEIITQAIEQNASDIHINPDDHELHLRYRIDGVLHPRQGPALAAHGALVRRLKVMASLDVTQTRRPQDGKIKFKHHGTEFDIRFSVIPTVSGENVVMRILRHNSAISSFEELGMAPETCQVFNEAITKPHGIILVTGPTGSGKTTTLYTALARLNQPNRNIMTIEDPVEIRLPMVRQTQANPEIGLTFATALRSILRQDPDVVLVGEIRDRDTAQIALQASLTGHLVLSTLHTNDAVGAVARLRDFGVPPFAINSALLCVGAQRLVRRVCPHCAKPYTPTPEERHAYGIRETELSGFVQGQGCSECMNSGYKGRVGVYEVLRVTPGVQRVIENEGATNEIRDAAALAGMRLMWQDGLDKARQGKTTIEELAKVRAGFDDADHESPETSGRTDAPAPGRDGRLAA
ncbi:MAG: type II/IV secretion system protein [Phycisphaeraceae bacterium]|nr:type II/IV secretion system protein [Phycisphaeraceae bacterium]